MSALRQAVRSLGRSPLFLFTAVGSIAVGIGACTSVFAVLNAVFLRPLPYEAPERLVDVFATRHVTSSEPSDVVAGERARLWPRKRFRTLEGLAIEGEASFDLERAGGQQGTVRRVTVSLVSGEWFRLLGVDAQLGRLLGPDDDAIFRVLQTFASAQDRQVERGRVGGVAREVNMADPWRS